MSREPAEPISPPDEGRLDKLRDRLFRLNSRRDQIDSDLDRVRSDLAGQRRFLGLSDQVSDALESLSEQLFQNLLKIIETHLTNAIQEVLDQPIALKSIVDWKRNAIAVDFYVEREGHREDILRGQGGAVANILSVGLRLFALTRLESDKHRRVLILDEQDCWLRADLISNLVRIIKAAANELGFQVIMISHHDVSAFEGVADRIYHLQRDSNTVKLDRADEQA